MRWKRHRRRQHVSVPAVDHPAPPDANIRTHAEAAAQQLADLWHAAPADERAEIEAAVAEQRNFMDAHGINGFRACTRTWDTPETSLPSAADIRAQTEFLRTVVASAPPIR